MNNARLLVTLVVLTIFFGCKKDTSLTDKKELEQTHLATNAALEYNTFSQLSKDPASNSLFIYDATSNPEGKLRKWQGCPSIGVENGHYFAVWFANETDEGIGSYIVVSESDDKGHTWGTNNLIIAADSANKRQMDQAVWNDKFGNLHISWTTVKGSWDGGAGGIWHIKIKKDNGKIVITKPSRLFSGVMNVKPTHMRKDSSLLIFPVSGWNIGDTFFGEKSIPTPASINGALLYSATYDANNNLTTPKLYSRIPVDNSKRLLDEHMIMATDEAENNWFAILRTVNGLTTSTSTDGGYNWTMPAISSMFGANTPTRAYLGKLKSGNTVMVMNNAPYRTNLTMFLSKDNGKTWPYKFSIEKTLDCSYPDVTQDADGNICLVYDRGGRTAAGEVVFATFTEQNVLNNETSAIRKTVISKF